MIKAARAAAPPEREKVLGWWGNPHSEYINNKEKLFHGRNCKRTSRV